MTTDFVHDGINPVTESSPGGTGLLLTGLGVDDFLLRLGPGSTSMFLTDALGSLVATTDAAGGVQSQVTYEPFGNTEISSPAPAYRFTGREHDEPMYLYYYRARYYHTDLQRFISEDPIGFAGGDINLYGYVRNNPLTLIDPLGLDVTITRWSCCFGADHTGIGVNTSDTVGFYPVHPRRPADDGIVAQDSVRNTPDEFKGSFTIKTTPEQDAKIQAYIDERTKNPRGYNVLSGRHCGGFVQGALRAGGIDPFGDVMIRGSFFDALKVLNEAGVDFQHGSVQRAQ